MTTAKLEAALDEIKTLCQSVAYHPQPSLSVFANLIEQIEAIAKEATANDGVTP